jgi:hypothetical protein
LPDELERKFINKMRGEEEEEQEEEIGDVQGISRSASAGRLNLVHQGCSKVHIARIFEATHHYFPSYLSFCPLNFLPTKYSLALLSFRDRFSVYKTISL